MYHICCNYHLSNTKKNDINMKVKKTNAIGYARISTNEDKQKYGLDVQKKAIIEYCHNKNLKLIKIYQDSKSGKSLDRPGINDLLKNKDSFHVLIVLKIDRLSRSLFELLKLIKEDLKGKDIVFIQEGIDQRTKEGRLLLHQLASFAEYERELIISRIRDGLAEAKRNGIRLGAVPKYQEYISDVKRMREEGIPWKNICQNLGINYRTAKKCINVPLQ